jgi:hypothetical protein
MSTPTTVNRQVAWARGLRARMIASMGGKCVICGLTTNLTFDCIRPMGGNHHRMSSVKRMTFYLAQWRAGNLQVLCHQHNSEKGAKPQQRYLPTLAPSLFGDPQFPKD